MIIDNILDLRSQWYVFDYFVYSKNTKKLTSAIDNWKQNKAKRGDDKCSDKSSYLKTFQCNSKLQVQFIKNYNFIKVVLIHDIHYPKPNNIQISEGLEAFI